MALFTIAASPLPPSALVVENAQVIDAPASAESPASERSPSNAVEVVPIETEGPSLMEEEILANEIPAQPEIDEATQKERAQAFDRYLTGRMNRDETNAYLTACETAPKENPFCYSVLNQDELERKKANAPKDANHRRQSAVAPRFRGRRLLNWDDLRFAPVPGVLKGVLAASPSELAGLRHAAVQEKRCPDNASIAVAAAIEDFLPERASYKEIARLYEKGADCMNNQPAEQEHLLSRAGLFYFAAQDYKTAARVFARASDMPNDVFTARSLYWLYRSRQQNKDKKGAETALAKLKTRYPFSFHTLVAMTASGADPGAILDKNRPTRLTRSTQRPSLNLLIEQVETLHRFGYENTANRVLDWAVAHSQEAEPELRLYLAELKRSQNDYRGKITLLTDVLYKHPALISRKSMELYFPKVYFPIFEKHAGAIDPYLLLAIARRESAFNTRAISSANARGLMQLLPSTGRLVKKYRPNLIDPNENILAGSRYVLELLRRLNGQIHLALASYNAGPVRVNAWTSRYPLNEPILFIDLIPYRETREYVASVLRNYYWYRRIHHGDDKMTPQKLLETTVMKSSN